MQNKSAIVITDANGAATLDFENLFGLLARVTIQDVDLDSGADITIKTIAYIKNTSSGEKEALETTLQTLTNHTGDVNRAYTVNTYLAGETDEDTSVLYAMAGETLRITIAQGGNAKKARVRVILA